MLTEDVPETLRIDRDNVTIIDGQVVVQSMTKLLGMKKIRDLGDTFIKRIDRLVKGNKYNTQKVELYLTGISLGR